MTKRENKKQIRCGIDLGGTKIEGMLLAINDGGYQIVERLRLPTEQEKGYRHILEQIKKLIQELGSKSGVTITNLGICTPGSIDPTTNTLKNSNTVCLNGKPIKSDLEAMFGLPVAIANDANCFALAEATLGSVPAHAPDAEVVFGVIMGTGVGGGIVFDGKAINGQQGIGGEWGHNFLDSSGGSATAAGPAV